MIEAILLAAALLVLLPEVDAAWVRRRERAPR